jgi:integrase
LPGLKFSARTRPEQVSVAFARAAKKAGVLDFRFHDLRHTAASWLRMQVFGAERHPSVTEQKMLKAESAASA